MAVKLWQSYTRWAARISEAVQGTPRRSVDPKQIGFAEIVQSHHVELAPPTAPPSRFELVINFGFKSIPSVAWPRRVAGVMRTLRIPAPMTIALILCSEWPTIVNELLNLGYPRFGLRQWQARMWLFASGVVVMAMLVSALGGWNKCKQAARPIAGMLRRSPERAYLDSWIERYVARKYQYLTAIPVGILACAFLSAVKPVLSRTVDVNLASYLMVFWVGIIGANVVYWLCVVGDFARRLRRSSNLTLLWHDPAMTPGLVALCDAYMYAASALSAGVILTELAALTLPNRSHSELLSYLGLLFPVVAGLVALWAAVQPFLPLYLMARDAKRRALAELNEALTFVKDDDYDKVLTFYFEVRTVSPLPINLATVVQYLAAILGVMLGFAVPKLFGIISGVGR